MQCFLKESGGKYGRISGGINDRVIYGGICRYILELFSKRTLREFCLAEFLKKKIFGRVSEEILEENFQMNFWYHFLKNP